MFTLENPVRIVGTDSTGTITAMYTTPDDTVIEFEVTLDSGTPVYYPDYMLVSVDDPGYVVTTYETEPVKPTMATALRMTGDPNRATEYEFNTQVYTGDSNWVTINFRLFEMLQKIEDPFAAYQLWRAVTDVENYRKRAIAIDDTMSRVNDAMNTFATDQGWCDSYEDGLDTLNGIISASSMWDFQFQGRVRTISVTVTRTRTIEEECSVEIEVPHGADQSEIWERAVEEIEGGAWVDWNEIDEVETEITDVTPD